MTTSEDPRDRSKENQYAPGDPDQPPGYEFEPQDFREQGDEQVLTTPPDEVEESFEPESELDTDSEA